MGRLIRKDMIDWVGDPFELDNKNIPHLSKHCPYTHEVLDYLLATDFQLVALKDPLRGPAEILMLAEYDCDILQIFLAPSNSGDLTKVRPVSLNIASPAYVKHYHENVDKKGGTYE